jgi:hypothetical protein
MPDQMEQIRFDELPSDMQAALELEYGDRRFHPAKGLTYWREIGTNDYFMVVRPDLWLSEPHC